MKTLQKIEGIKIEFIDICLADYFNGSHDPSLHVYPDRCSTVLDVIEMLKDEINQIGDHIEHSFEADGFEFSYDMLDNALKEFTKANSKNLGEIAFPSLDFSYDETEDENEEYPQAIFTVSPMEL